MRDQTTRELLVTSALFTAVFSAINLWLTGFDVISTLFTAPFFLVRDIHLDAHLESHCAGGLAPLRPHAAGTGRPAAGHDGTPAARTEAATSPSPRPRPSHLRSA